MAPGSRKSVNSINGTRFHTSLYLFIYLLVINDSFTEYKLSNTINSPHGWLKNTDPIIYTDSIQHFFYFIFQCFLYWLYTFPYCQFSSCGGLKTTVTGSRSKNISNGRLIHSAVLFYLVRNVFFTAYTISYICCQFSSWLVEKYRPDYIHRCHTQVIFILILNLFFSE